MSPCAVGSALPVYEDARAGKEIITSYLCHSYDWLETNGYGKYSQTEIFEMPRVQVRSSRSD